MVQKKRRVIPVGVIPKKAPEFGDTEPTAADGSETELVQKDSEEMAESAGPEAVSQPEEEKVPEIPPSPAEEAPYTMGQWGGLPQWQCKLCAWDTLEGEAAMLTHIASAHAPPPKPKSSILIADKNGRQVN